MKWTNMTIKYIFKEAESMQLTMEENGERSYRIQIFTILSSKGRKLFFNHDFLSRYMYIK